MQTLQSSILALAALSSTALATVTWHIPEQTNGGTPTLNAYATEGISALEHGSAFHGIGGGAADVAGGFGFSQATLTGGGITAANGSLIDANSSIDLVVGQQVNLAVSYGSLNVRATTSDNAVNQLLQIGLTTAASGDAFASDSLFLSGLQGASTIQSDASLNFNFSNEAGAIGLVGNVGSATIDSSRAGFSNVHWLVGISYLRNADDSISYGVSINKYDAQGAGPYTYTQDLSVTGTLSAAEHGLTTFTGLNAAIGFDAGDIQGLSVTGASYDWNSLVENDITFPNLTVAAVPEPSSSALLSLAGLSLLLRRKR